MSDLKRKVTVRKILLSQFIDILIELEFEDIKYIDLECLIGGNEDHVQIVAQKEEGITDEDGLLTDDTIRDLLND